MRMTRLEFEAFRKRKLTEVKNKKPIRKGRGMNKTETRYANLLELRLRAGEISCYKYESIKLRLADNTTYTPDFMVTGFAGMKHVVEFHEVKGGFVREDSWIKLKVAAEMYPEFKFVLARYTKGNWDIREVK